MEIETQLAEILKSRNAGAFLFVGSGFSRRYLNLEDWAGLLARFAVAGKHFEYYMAAADGDLPKAAKLLAIDFNEHWWSAAEYAGSVSRYKSKVSNSTSALRIEISNYLLALDSATAGKSSYRDEIILLSRAVSSLKCNTGLQTHDFASEYLGGGFKAETFTRAVV